MPQSSFPCPYCSAPLRTRNRELIGKQITCPDCGKQLLIVSDGPRKLAARKAESAGSRRSKSGSKLRIPETPHRLQRVLHVLKSPVGIAWTVAGSLAVLLFLAAWPFGDSPPPNRPPMPGEESTSEKPPDDDTLKITGEGKTNKNGVKHLPEFPEPVVAVKPVPAAVAAGKPPQSDPPPVVAEIPPETIDLAAALAQPILRFDQNEAAPLRDLLMLVEEMAGVPLRYPEMQPENRAKLLDRPVTLQLQNTTVGEILKELLKQAHLDYRPGINEIHVIPGETNESKE